MSTDACPPLYLLHPTAGAHCITRIRSGWCTSPVLLKRCRWVVDQHGVVMACTYNAGGAA